MFFQRMLHKFIKCFWAILTYLQLVKNKTLNIVPVSVNYHFTRKCNYSCGFCFHTAKTSYVAPLGDIKVALRKLMLKGMKKLNLSGGEPFLYPELVGEICKFCKVDLNLESVSIVTNGSKVKESFFKKYGVYVDYIAVSVDSFDEETNINIGRGKGKHLIQLDYVSQWCQQYNIRFKLNTVVNRFNHLEDLSQNIALLNPFRWKCFQVLPVDTENVGQIAKRDCSEFLITDDEFGEFCRRHQHLPCFVPVSNVVMKNSYIILDEYLRFLNKGDFYKESESILNVDDIDPLLQSTDYKHNMFIERGGYDWWTKRSACDSVDPELDW
ncbi:radical S-adenosyl methionine domain-containing protein 2-like [Bradysia coprophila]|uniref:radical S-adenosyl methionine domain-containing protein 2-like n=1 Tax=Bradysia coprophila TaxID=38358 RepID=UPI00187DA8B2|nr:radical S-adenosyl methionine domain-containing protein 2-like [Bradysia coprophila]